jgi:hypothetical protein
MADTNDLLQQIRQVVREEVTAETEPIKTQLAAQGKQLDVLADTTSHTTTAVEALGAGQREIQETMATKADVQDVKADLVKKVRGHERRISSLEDELDIPHPQKN